MYKNFKCAQTLKKSVPTPNSQALIKYLNKTGWIVILLDTPKGRNVLKAFGLFSYGKGKDSFSFVENSKKCVYIKQKLPEKEMQFLLLHEIGHITLGHNLSCLSLQDENEANNFAKLCQLMYKLPSFKTAAISALVICVLAFSAKAIPLARNAVTDVCVTQSGEKYHKQDCRFVYGKDGVRVISLTEASKSGYEPCKVCFALSA